jgi:hypothetical protein
LHRARGYAQDQDGCLLPTRSSGWDRTRLISSQWLEWNLNGRINVIYQIEGCPKLKGNDFTLFSQRGNVALTFVCYCLNSDHFCQAKPMVLWFGETPDTFSEKSKNYSEQCKHPLAKKFERRWTAFPGRFPDRNWKVPLTIRCIDVIESQFTMISTVTNISKELFKFCKFVPGWRYARSLRYLIQGGREVFAISGYLRLLWRFRLVIIIWKTITYARPNNIILFGINSLARSVRIDLIRKDYISLAKDLFHRSASEKRTIQLCLLYSDNSSKYRWKRKYILPENTGSKLLAPDLSAWRRGMYLLTRRYV